MKYAGIGSRETPVETLNLMTLIAFRYGQHGWFLRSGGARGADQAFERGANTAGHNWVSFNANDTRPEWLEMAAKYHPAWNKCNDFAKMLHARNCAIILGAELNAPVDCVVCWTKDGKATGGTGQALRIADNYNIPVYNLYFEKYRSWYETFTA